MKKFWMFVVSIVFLSYGIAFGAGEAQMNTGCGLGTVIFKNKSDDSLLLQVLQATTNGTFGNQTFGITSGTLECKRPNSIVKNEELNHFVAENLDNLAKDIARGNGETLDAFAELAGITPEARPQIYAKLQANFSNIFPSEKVEYADVVDNIMSVISEG